MPDPLLSSLNARLVLMCDDCGRGFLVPQPGGVDNQPIWWTMGGEEGGICGGAIRAFDIRKAMWIADNMAKGGKRV
jgi:hypothetical protein